MAGIMGRSLLPSVDVIPQQNRSHAPAFCAPATMKPPRERRMVWVCQSSRYGPCCLFNHDSFI